MLRKTTRIAAHFAADLYCSSICFSTSLAQESLKMQVPEKVFVTDKLPKTATGKIQRRMMVEAFMKNGEQGSQPKAEAKSQGKPTSPRSRL